MREIELHEINCARKKKGTEVYLEINRKLSQIFRQKMFDLYEGGE